MTDFPNPKTNLNRAQRLFSYTNPNPNLSVFMDELGIVEQQEGGEKDSASRPITHNTAGKRRSQFDKIPKEKKRRRIEVPEDEE